MKNYLVDGTFKISKNKRIEFRGEHGVITSIDVSSFRRFSDNELKKIYKTIDTIGDRSYIIVFVKEIIPKHIHIHGDIPVINELLIKDKGA